LESGRIHKNLDDRIFWLANTQKEKIDNNFKSYPRAVNQTDILFTEEEQTLLNKCLKYNLGHKHKFWIRKLALEAESAITLLPIEELKILNQIKEKLRRNKALLTKADKGNSAVILYLEDYEQKVLEFISKNGADLTDNNVTATFQKDLRHTLKGCKLLSGTKNIGKFVNLNPEAATLR